MIYDILGVGVLLFLSGVAIFAVGIHFFIVIASLFAKPISIGSTDRYVKVKEKDYDYDTDY
jgi:hypothetical protein